MRRRRVPPGLTMAAAVAAALLAGGCDGGGGGLGQPSRDASSPAPVDGRRPSEDSLVRRLLARRAAALRDGDARALAATATGAQRARDRRAARRAQRLRLDEVRIEPEALEVRGTRAVVRATLTYSLKRVSGRFGSRRRMMLQRTRGGWRVAEIARGRQRPPWEVADFRRVRSPHFVVLAPATVDLSVADLPAALEAGYTRLESVLRRGRLRGRYLAIVAERPTDARALTARIRGVEGLAALTDSEVSQEGSAERVTEVAGQRLLVVWPAMLALGFEARATVVAHELTHAVMAPETSGRTPAWLVEGLALYVSGDRRTDEAVQLLNAQLAGGPAEASVTRALRLAGLADPDAIARLDGEAQSAAYAYASAAAFHIAEVHGLEALLDLHDVFNAEDLPGAGGDRTLSDAAVRRVLGRSLGRLDRELRAWLGVPGA